MKLLQLIREALGTTRDSSNGEESIQPAVLDHGAFRRELLRQRALADRAGSRFVLAVFDAPLHAAGNGSTGAALLSAVIRERARLSDVVGIYEPNGHRLAVILPDTTATGAAIFVRSVDELLRSRLNGQWRADRPLMCEISHYPDNGRLAASEEREIEPKHELVAGEPLP